MSGSEKKSRRSVKKKPPVKKPVRRKASKEMNWMQIDEILWDMISQWDGMEKSKEKLLKDVSKIFDWTDKQTEKACEMHFIVYNKKKA